MSNSANLALPMLQAAQAQKHVTVNEALTILDGAVQLILQATDQTVPPATPNDGDCYGVPAGATGVWAANVGDIALWANGAWVFVAAAKGWRAFVTDASQTAVFDGANWKLGAAAVSPNNAATAHDIIEIEVNLSAGPTTSATAAIPGNSMVIGVTGRVTSAVSGALTSFRVGVSGSDDRYGSGIGLAQGSWLRGLTSAPLTYYADTDILITGEGGDIAGGAVRLAIHVIRLSVPD